MIKLKQWMELVDYRVTEGSDYHVNIPGLFLMSSWNGDQKGWSMEIAFDPRDDQRVYLVEAHDYGRNRAYRLKDPALEIGQQAWDDVDFVDLEADEDFLAKAQAIIADEDYDTRVIVPVDFSDDELLHYMKLAHEQDITFNQLVERALTVFIEQHKDLQ